MDKKKIEKRIEEIKKSNDKINSELNKLEELKNKLIQEAISNNGRILELQELLK